MLHHMVSLLQGQHLEARMLQSRSAQGAIQPIQLSVLILGADFSFVGLVMVMKSVAIKLRKTWLHKFSRFTLAGLVLGTGTAIANIFQTSLGNVLGAFMGIIAGSLITGYLGVSSDNFVDALGNMETSQLTRTGVGFFIGGLLGIVGQLLALAGIIQIP